MPAPAHLAPVDIGVLAQLPLSSSGIPPQEAQPGDLVLISGDRWMLGGSLRKLQAHKWPGQPPLPAKTNSIQEVVHRLSEVVGPPMPPGELAEAFSKVAFPGPFRRYQGMAIDAFEKSRASGRRRAYLVLPPGAGKTLVGLEIARRLGNPTLALGPNTAIQEQWVKQWRAYQPATVEAGDSPDLKTPITALTYQSICNLDSHNPALDEQIAEWQSSLDSAHPATADG